MKCVVSLYHHGVESFLQGHPFTLLQKMIVQTFLLCRVGSIAFLCFPAQQRLLALSHRAVECKKLLKASRSSSWQNKEGLSL